MMILLTALGIAAVTGLAWTWQSLSAQLPRSNADFGI